MNGSPATGPCIGGRAGAGAGSVNVNVQLTVWPSFRPLLPQFPLVSML